MLSNAYLLAKFRFDTAENERNLPSFCQNFGKIFAVFFAAEKKAAEAAEAKSPKAKAEKAEKTEEKVRRRFVFDDGAYKFWKVCSRLHRRRFSAIQGSFEIARRDLISLISRCNN